MKQKKQIEDFLEVKIANDKSIIVEMQVLDDSNFLSPYCSNYYIANDEVISYLNNRIKNVNPKVDLELHIKSNVIDDQEKIIYEQAIKNYYKSEKKQLTTKLVNNLIVSLIMFLIGLIIISIMIFMSYNNYKEVWTTVLDIIGWVFIWETIDKFCFERREIKREYRKAEQFINAKIIFLDSEF